MRDREGGREREGGWVGKSKTRLSKAPMQRYVAVVKDAATLYTCQRF